MKKLFITSMKKKFRRFCRHVPGRRIQTTSRKLKSQQ